MTAESAEAIPLGTASRLGSNASDAQRRWKILAGQIAIGVALLVIWESVSGRWIDPF